MLLAVTLLPSYFSKAEPFFFSYLLSSPCDLSSPPAALDSRFIARLVFSFENSAAEHSLLLVHVRGLITLLLILDMHKIEAWPSFNPPSAIDGGCPLINIKDLQCTEGSCVYFGFAVTVTVDPHLVKKGKEKALPFARKPIYLCSLSTSFNMGLVMIKGSRIFQPGVPVYYWTCTFTILGQNDESRWKKGNLMLTK